jgi:hypothetical protein
VELSHEQRDEGVTEENGKGKGMTTVTPAAERWARMRETV